MARLASRRRPCPVRSRTRDGDATPRPHGELLARLTFLVGLGLLCLPWVSVAAQTEPLRIRSSFATPAGELSAIVELPPGPAPKSTDFGLLIDGRPVVSARETQDQRLNLMFLVDVSGSMKGSPLNDIKSALPEFLLAKEIRPQDQFALTFFADEDRLTSSFEEPRDRINNALRNVRTEGKQTKLYRALYNALKQGLQDDPQRRRIIVVLSDGLDEGSDVTLDQVINESRARLVPIYAVYRGEIERFADVLTGLANAAGGKSFSTHSRDEIKSALDQIYQLETNSVTVRFSYAADQSGRVAQNAEIVLRRPDGPDLRAALRERIPAPHTPVPARWPWILLLFVLLVLVGGGGFWLWRRTAQPPRDGIAPTPGEDVKSKPTRNVVDVVAVVAPALPRRETVVIGQYFPAPASGRPAVLLRGLSGPVAGQEHAMDREIFSVGANAGSDLQIAGDEYVSGEHAFLRYEQGSLFIFDKGSRNGTFVNGSRVPENGMVLRPGDQVTLGNSKFSVVMPAP